MIAAPADIYEPRGGALKLFQSKATRILLDGPAGTGKTRGILEYAYAVMGKYPGLRVLACRKTRASMTDSVLVTWEVRVLGVGHPMVADGPSRDTRREYELPNGSVMVIGGLDKPEKTFSAEYDLVLVFEAIECDEDDIELLLRTLRSGRRVINGKPVHQLIMDTNPGPEGHWLNHRDGWMQRILSRHEDNPYLYDKREDGTWGWTEAGIAYIAILDALSGHRKERLRHGRWVAAEGVVYPEFDANVHCIDAMPTGWETWPKRRSIDFGVNDPFVCQWWAMHDDEWFMYREIYMSGRTVATHARQIVALSQGESYECTTSDHDLGVRGTLNENGVDTSPAVKDIEQGIDAVKARLLPSLVAALGNSRGRLVAARPRLFFLRGALVEVDRRLEELKRPTCTVAEFDCYLYKRHKDGIEKDEPVDRDNHGMDTMRYLVASLGGSGPCVGAALPDPKERMWQPWGSSGLGSMV